MAGPGADNPGESHGSFFGGFRQCGPKIHSGAGQRGKHDIRYPSHGQSDLGQGPAARLVDPGFGRVFTDHMAIVRYSTAKGWHDARIESRANFPLDPALAVLHYAQEIFEGLKAYTRDDGGVNLFRPDANAKRFLEQYPPLLVRLVLLTFSILKTHK